MLTPDRLESLILEKLASRESGQLTLLVSLRKAMSGAAPYKGDLSRAVNVALRRLIASKAIIDTDGVFSVVSN